MSNDLPPVNETTPVAQAPGRGRTRRYVVGGLLVAAAGFAALTASGIGRNLVYYWGPTELHAAGKKAVGASIRLGGLVAPGSVVRTGGASGVVFDVIDRQGGRVHVVSSGVPPQMFREQIGVVVEGTLSEAGHFEGHRLMVSHSNEYRVPGESGKDTKDLMGTTKGLYGEEPKARTP